MKKFTSLFILAILANVILGSSAFGQITQVGTAQSAANSGTTVTILKPAGIQVGDVMIANITQNETSGGIDLGDNASLLGWTLIDGRALNADDDPEYWGTLLYKVAVLADVSAPSYAFALDPEADGGIGAIVAFRNVDITTGVTATGAAGGPFDVDPGIINGIADDNSLNADEISTASTNAAVIMFGLIGNNPNITDGSWLTATSPGVLTELYDAGTGNGDDNAVAAAWAIKPATGLTGAGSATVSATDVNGSILIALKSLPVPPSATLSPSSTQNILAGGSVNFTATANNYTGSGNYTYTWTAAGATIPGSNPNSIAANSDSKTLTYASPGTYTVSVSIARTGSSTLATNTTTVIVAPPANLWATSSSGTQVSSFTVSNGTYISGPDNIFVPNGGSTAALGKNPTGGTGGDNFYWLPNTGGNNGVISIYGATAAGGSQTQINSTFDVNAGSGNSLGFVRLAMDNAKNGWILAGDGASVYMAKFASNGTSAVVPVSVTVSLSGGLASTFTNGDVCIDGNNTMYALANNGSGLTQIFVGTLSNPTVTLTQKWNLVAPGGANFTGSVNGVAFDAQGSLYISTSTGLYFIDQTTVNTQGPGTVVCSLVQTVSGLQDLASNFFPTQTQLPVDLISFTGRLRNNVVTLNWETENEQNFDHFEIERRTDNGANYSKIGVKASLGSSLRSSYSFEENLAGISGSAFNYRLKIVDQDGKFKYSNVILIRKDQRIINGITLSPNPVIGGIATARFTASADGTVNLNVVDMSGKIVITQMAKVYEGENSISINNLDRLQPGIYVLRMEDQGAIKTIRFSIAR